jgi:hypothetical protein
MKVRYLGQKIIAFTLPHPVSAKLYLQPFLTQVRGSKVKFQASMSQVTSIMGQGSGAQDLEP